MSFAHCVCCVRVFIQNFQSLWEDFFRFVFNFFFLFSFLSKDVMYCNTQRKCFCFYFSVVVFFHTHTNSLSSALSLSISLTRSPFTFVFFFFFCVLCYPSLYCTENFCALCFYRSYVVRVQLFTENFVSVLAIAEV